MNRRNARARLVVLAPLCLGLTLFCLLPVLRGAQPSAMAPVPDAPAADAATPTPSPSDAPPPAPPAVDQQPAAPSACEPVAVEGEQAACRVVCGKRRTRCCRPRMGVRRVFHRRGVCCPCISATQAPAEQAEADPWKVLFDGKSLAGWKATNFGGEGAVEVRDGMIVMEMGGDMTGITFTGKPPRTNYELQLEGQRLQGSDFFCTTTFPVGEEHCSLVVGGWGGTVVGLSNVDYYDASDNLTTSFREFKDNTWYAIRIRVSDHKITAWIDDEQAVSQPRKGHKFDLRMEVDLSRPLGVSTWQSSGAVRGIRVRPLTADEIAADIPEDE